MVCVCLARPLRGRANYKSVPGFRVENKWLLSIYRTDPFFFDDVSPENLEKARAVVAAFKQALAKRKAKTKPSDAEPGLPRNHAFGYARFGGPYLKRP